MERTKPVSPKWWLPWWQDDSLQGSGFSLLRRWKKQEISWPKGSTVWGVANHSSPFSSVPNWHENLRQAGNRVCSRNLICWAWTPSGQPLLPLFPHARSCFLVRLSLYGMYRALPLGIFSLLGDSTMSGFNLQGPSGQSSIQPKPMLCSPGVHAAYAFFSNEDGTRSQGWSYTQYTIYS